MDADGVVSTSRHAPVREADDAGSRALRRLGQDRRHGATEIARTAFDALVLAAPTLPSATNGVARRRVAKWGRLLRSAQPAMGALVAGADRLVALSRSSPAGRLSVELEETCREILRRIEDEPAAIARVAKALFPPNARVVTNSRSSTIFRVLTSLDGAAAPQEVTVLRSLPGGEGAAASRALRAAGLRSRCIDDARRDEAVAPADLVLVGADTLFRDGAILHKVGTRGLAESAEHWHVPVVVAVGLTKFLPYRDRPPGRLSELFDRTPARLLREYWTDRGRWTRAEVVHAARRHGKGASDPPAGPA